MKKKYLMNGMAVLALGLMAVSCSKEVEYSPEASKNHAEDVLGVTIDSNQDWKMSQDMTAYVTVNLGLDQEYTVLLYDKNPLYNSDASYFGKQRIKEGGTAAMTISVPAASDTYYVAVFDTKNRCVVKNATIVDGLLDVTFGNNTANAPRRAMESDYQGSYAKTAEDFLNPTTGRDSYGNTWSLNTQTISVTEMEGYAMITDNDIKENSTLTNLLYTDKGNYYPGHSDGKHFRVSLGTEIKQVFHVSGTYGVYNDVVIYIQGKVHLNGNTLDGPTLVVASGGEIIIDGNTNMSNAGRIVVLPGGKISGKKDVVFNVNNGAPCYNAGTINFAGELNVNGSDTYNCGTINVNVLRNTSGGFFTNFGYITARTNTIQGDSYNSKVVNACYMHFTKDAGVGSITLLDNSRIDVDGQLYMTGTNTLYHLSEINCGSLYCQNAFIVGPTDQEYAVLKTKKMLVSHGGDFQAYNNMYVDCNPDELYAYDGKTNYKKTYSANDYQNTAAGYIVKNNVPNWSTEATAVISIPEGECTGAGYHPGDDGGDDIPGEPAVWTYAFEDSYYCDYDMNDVVIKVRENKDRVNKIDVTLCCTGANYNLYVYLKKTRLFGGNEVHSVLGGTAGKFINTGYSVSEKFERHDEYTTTIDKPSNFTFATADFWIKSPEGNIHVATSGQDPHGVVIPGDWQWPMEWVCIKDAYPNFVGFAADDTHSTNVEWYNYPDGNVY